MAEDRVLSAREQEQIETIGDRMKHVRDQVDERWPEVIQGAALIKDCYDALKKEGFPDAYAISLVGSLMNYLKG